MAVISTEKPNNMCEVLYCDTYLWWSGTETQYLWGLPVYYFICRIMLYMSKGTYSIQRKFVST